MGTKEPLSAWPEGANSPAPTESSASIATAPRFETLYSELHRLARSQLRRNPGATISATTLLHEAYLDLRERDGARFADRAHFMAYAARAMRGIVIDYARNRHAQKRGGEFHLTALDTEQVDEYGADAGEVTGLGDALDALERADPMLAELVDLKFFGGLTIAEVAALRTVSERTVERDWVKARLFLRRALSEDAD